MKIVIAGGTGFLGRPLAQAFAARGDEVVILSRGGGGSETRSTPQSAPPGPGESALRSQRTVAWTPDGSAGPWAAEIDGADAIVNLAGAGLADKRWTAARKQELRASRVLSTRSLVGAVRAATRRPRVFVHGSAIGFYGLTPGGERIDESSPPGDDFLAQLAATWETEARPIEALGVRLVIVRTGIVLSREGGALARMIPPFSFFVGGPIASGRQPYSWIHLDDWIALMVWAVDDARVTGVINGTAPEPVPNAEFSRALGRALHRPSWLPVPAFALRLLIGEMSDIALVGGQHVVPARARALGFAFRYPDIDSAMRAAVRSR